MPTAASNGTSSLQGLSAVGRLRRLVKSFVAIGVYTTNRTHCRPLGHFQVKIRRCNASVDSSGGCSGRTVHRAIMFSTNATPHLDGSMRGSFAKGHDATINCAIYGRHYGAKRCKAFGGCGLSRRRIRRPDAHIRWVDGHVRCSQDVCMMCVRCSQAHRDVCTMFTRCLMYYTFGH